VPTRPSRKGGLERSKTFSCEGGIDERWSGERGEKLSGVPLHSVRTPNLHTKPRKGSLT
jgi:hypothetical protein